MYLLMVLAMALPALGERSERRLEAGLQGEMIYPELEVAKSLDDLVRQVYHISIITCYAAHPREKCDELREPTELKAEQDRRLNRDPNL